MYLIIAYEKTFFIIEQPGDHHGWKSKNWKCVIYTRKVCMEKYSKEANVDIMIICIFSWLTAFIYTLLYCIKTNVATKTGRGQIHADAQELKTCVAAEFRCYSLILWNGINLMKKNYEWIF